MEVSEAMSEPNISKKRYNNLARVKIALQQALVLLLKKS